MITGKMTIIELAKKVIESESEGITLSEKLQAANILAMISCAEALCERLDTVGFSVNGIKG